MTITLSDYKSLQIVSVSESAITHRIRWNGEVWEEEAAPRTGIEFRRRQLRERGGPVTRRTRSRPEQDKNSTWGTGGGEGGMERRKKGSEVTGKCESIYHRLVALEILRKAIVARKICISAEATPGVLIERKKVADGGGKLRRAPSHPIAPLTGDSTGEF